MIEFEEAVKEKALKESLINDKSTGDLVSYGGQAVVEYANSHYLVEGYVGIKDYRQGFVKVTPFPNPKEVTIRKANEICAYSDDCPFDDCFGRTGQKDQDGNGIFCEKGSIASIIKEAEDE